MTALVIGATGAVGKDLVDLLLKDDSFESVSVFVRRPLGIENPRLTVHLVDFDLPGQWLKNAQSSLLESTNTQWAACSAFELYFSE